MIAALLAVSSFVPVVQHGAARTWRSHRQPTMIEAYDLLPVVDCLKESDWDAVDMCMSTLEPWLSAEDGTLAFSVNAVNGFIGGSVGVVGTVVATLIKKSQVKERLKCTYCNGTGEIVCGVCLRRGTVQSLNDDGVWEMTNCHNCEATGTVVCINCQGSGLAVPDDFLQVLGDSELGFSDDDYIGLFDEVKFPTAEPRADELPETSTVESGADASRPVGAGAGAEPAEAFDPSGGMG